MSSRTPQPECKVCEGWGAYCDEHRPAEDSERLRAQLEATLSVSQRDHLRALIEPHDCKELIMREVLEDVRASNAFYQLRRPLQDRIHGVLKR